MHTVEREDDQDDEVGNQQGRVKPVPAVKVLEGRVGVMGMEVLRDAVLDEEDKQGREG